MYCESKARSAPSTVKPIPTIPFSGVSRFRRTKNVKRLCRDYLTPEELRLVTQAHNFLEERLQTRVI
jgi:hypothetical protein